MYKLTKGEFIKAVSNAKTEEDVKFAYAHNFKIKFDSSDDIDLYTPQVLFEFKYDKNLQNKKALAEILSQALYYIHRLKYGITDKCIPSILCIADKNEACFTEIHIWKSFYTDEENKYDWDLAPSTPDKQLVKDIFATEELRNIHIHSLELEHSFQEFTDKLSFHLNPLTKLDFGDKKLITEQNFEDVYKYWENVFGESVRNGQKPSKYFVSDIQEGNTIVREQEGKILFRIGANDYREKKILNKDYSHFWSLYEKVTNPHTIRGILAKVDRLTDEFQRRFHGEFFTPLDFARKGLEYLEKTIGKNWWQNGYRLWDMAAGTGNLQYYLPYEAYKNCYLSTLYNEDVEHLRKLFPDADCFQYDYLNDDVTNVIENGQSLFKHTWKLPEKLRKDLTNPEIRWVVLMNPPFATSQTAGTSGRSKKDVSNTNIRMAMHNDGLGEVSRELTMQFLYRIKKEFANKAAHLGLFYKIKFINSNNDQKFRDKVFHYGFERGFIFSSANFSGTSKNSPFPVGFIVWDLNKKLKIENQKIEVDIFNDDQEKIGVKKIGSEPREKHLSKWIKRPPATDVFPPVGSAINVKHDNLDVRDRVAKGFLGSLMCGGNDFQHQGKTCILSMPYVSAGAFSITPANFEQSMIIHAVRKIPKATWLNDRDQFLKPNTELPQEFINDCTVWNLFSGSNQTAALKDVEYKKKTYQVHNHFFPFLKAKLLTWKIADADIALGLTTDEDRFVAIWLAQQKISENARAVLKVAEKIYEYYFAHLHELRTAKFEILTWDAGWYQVRNSLADEQKIGKEFEELKHLHKILGDSILPRISEYGFLS